MEGEEVLVAIVWNSNLRTQHFTTSRHSAAHLEEANSSSDQTVALLDSEEFALQTLFPSFVAILDYSFISSLKQFGLLSGHQ